MTYGQQTGWNEERTGRLVQLQIDGLSASQMAAALGGLSRSAVIGKLARMGLGGKYSRSRGGEHSQISRKVREGRRVPGSNIAPRKGPLRTINHEFSCTEIVEPSPDQSTASCTLLELNGHTCRWPIGDPGQPGFGFCGVTPYSKAVPYCAAHCRRAFQVRARA